MPHWFAFLEDDEDGNACIYLQQGKDEATRELYEMVEHDVVDALPGQAEAYLEEAEKEALDRN